MPVLLLFIWLVSFHGMGGYRMTKGLRPLIRNIENKIVLYKTRKFTETETDTFVFRYEDIDDKILELIKDTAKSKYREIADIFQYEFEDKILVVIYNNTNLMMKTTMLRRGDPPIGVYYGDSIHILNPELWVEKSEGLEYVFCNKGPMLHELTHLFTDHVGNGNFPMWFTEGVSLYFEYLVDGYEWGKGIPFTDTDTYTIKELNNNLYGPDQYRAYTQSFRLVRNMVDSYGLDKLINTITLLGKGHNMNEFIYLFEKV
ncbi:MAG: hypothetical protein GX925_05485 [Clostridiales bacterium]|nr:hypothetical protein [Clostridiales bacterium]